MSEHENTAEDEQEETYYQVSVLHTDTLTGAPDLHEEQTLAVNEEAALENVKRRSSWPEEEFYEDDDVDVNEM